MKAAENFLLLLLHAHIVTAAQTIQEYISVTSVSELAKRIIANFVQLVPNTTQEPPMDGVHFYAIELLSLSLIWHRFHEAIREADGECIIRYWKLLLVIFKAYHHNYAQKKATPVLLSFFPRMTENTAYLESEY